MTVDQLMNILVRFPGTAIVRAADGYEITGVTEKEDGIYLSDSAPTSVAHFASGLQLDEDDYA